MSWILAVTFSAVSLGSSPRVLVVPLRVLMEICMAMAALSLGNKMKAVGPESTHLRPRVPAKDVHAASQTALVLSGASSFRSVSGIIFVDGFFSL